MTMAGQKTKKDQLVFGLTFKRCVNDAIDFHVIFLPLPHNPKNKLMSNLEKWLNRIITIATALLAILNYILAHLPKVSIMALIILSTSINAQQHSLRWYPFEKKVIWPKPPHDPPHPYMSAEIPPVPTTPIPHTTFKPYVSIPVDTTLHFVVNKSIFLSPSVGFNVYTYENSSHNYSYGSLPAVGYGIKYNPYFWNFGYLIGLDLFASVAEIHNSVPGTHDYLKLDIIPVFSFITFIHIGYGYRWRLGAESPEIKNSSIFIIGLSLPLS
jgi:hypothetical protein